MSRRRIALLIIALVALVIGSSGTFFASTDPAVAQGTETPQSAPLNPDFEKYWENPPEEWYGYIPPPMDFHLAGTPVQGAQAAAQVLLSEFDWRDEGKVTAVKDQNTCGTCWIFGATSALESKVLLDESVSYDLSEQSVALCVDPSWVYLYDGYDNNGDPQEEPCDAGGWGWLAGEAFMKKGAVLESCNPYNPSALNCDGACVCDSCTPVKKVNGYRLVTDDGTQISTIKNAILDHGPLMAAYSHTASAEYWDTTWGAIYDCYPCSEDPGHMVSIIGWDDNVPHPNLNHEGTGAWIIKNSWGTADSWAGGAGVSDGYFYLAYDSGSVGTEIAYFEYKDYDPSESLLYWDEAGLVTHAGCMTPDAWMANVYTADSAGDLTHVDFYTTSSNASYDIYVWDGYLSSGTQLAHQTGTCAEPGYYSIPLSSPLSLDAGVQFTL
ncbi:MAG: lectin like domain-containing protein, partial [Dehalococcoidia bacterium]|nr:lectin like domain-containing protein [Dehalococcoidia bacterium]